MKNNFYLLVTGMVILLLPLAINAQDGPMNDACSDAIAVSLDEEVSFSTLGADADGPNHPDDCTSSGVAPDSLGADIWYTFTSPLDGYVEWSLCGTADFDTKIAIYTPGTSCPPVNEDLYACNEDGEDSGGVACANATSVAVFEVTEGDTYLLRLGGWISPDSASAGTGTFLIQETAPPPPGPDNDDCEDAIAIGLGEGQPISNTNATTDGPVHPGDQVCFGFGDNTAQADIWYTFTSPITSTIQWSTCGLVSWDSRLVVYGPDISCADASPDNMIACSDATSGCENFTNILFFDAVEGDTYLMRVGGYGGDNGTGVFDLTATTPPDPPGNDGCAVPDTSYIISAEEADELTILFDGTTVSATGSPNVIDPLCGTGQGGDFPDVWYEFNSLGNTEVEVRFASTTPGAEFYMELYESCDGQIDMAVDTFCFNYDSELEGFLIDTITNLPPEPKDYLLRVSSWIFEPPGDFFFQLVGEIITETHAPTFPGTLEVFPNPANDRINLQLHLRAAADTHIELTNLLGQRLYYRDVGKLAGGNHSREIDISQIPPGIFMVRVHAGNAVRSMKVVKR